MASLQARSQLRSAHPLLLMVNKLVSLAFFVALLCGGWLALNYLRTELQGKWLHSSTSTVAPAPAPEPALQQAVEGNKQPSASRLVYFCQSDSGYYHASTHLQRCKRTALGEEAAIARGLKRCPVCLPEQ